MLRRSTFMYIGAILFLLSIPLISLVAGLAADLSEFHSLAGTAVWVLTAIAILVLATPVIQLFRLPAVPPREIWSNDSLDNKQVDWKRSADILIRTETNSDNKARLTRIRQEDPNRLPDEITKFVAARKKEAHDIRTSTMKRAALLSVLSPQKRLDTLLSLWLNSVQIFKIAKCYGYRPRPISIFKLYTSVIGGALLIDSFDEVAEEITVGIGASALTGLANLAGVAGGLLTAGVPLPLGKAAEMAGGFAYEAVRSAFYVALIGLYADHLARNELHKITAEQRKSFRKQARIQALDMLKEIGNNVSGLGEKQSS